MYFGTEILLPIFILFHINNSTSAFYKCGMIKTETLFSLYWIYSVCLWRKLLAYRNAFESVPGTNQFWAISVKFLAQGNNGLSLRGFEPKRLAILRLLVWRVNHSTMPPPIYIIYAFFLSFKNICQYIKRPVLLFRRICVIFAGAVWEVFWGSDNKLCSTVVKRLGLSAWKSYLT